jgi:lysophospholipase L1-like esterase
MAGFGIGTKKKRKSCSLLSLGIILYLASACKPVIPVVIPPAPTAFRTATFTPTHTITSTQTPTATPTPHQLTLVFYGDSVLKVGDINQASSEGFSFVDNLRASLPAEDEIIVSNHGGQRALWGYENLQDNVLRFKPDLVTVWWGMNDLGGCPGVFDRETNVIREPQLSAYIDEHVLYLRKQIDAILDQGGKVFLMTPIPVLGKLPWSHFTADYQLVWENDHHCDFNSALVKLVQAQRSLEILYTAEAKPVYLVDAWQVYKDNPDADKMYMDVVHPASHGVELIATEWLRVFHSIGFP